MAQRPKPLISQRKQPRQARSDSMVATVLEAAAQVLRAEGAARFTTARVAERAGVSIGSLYQYFPNKAAILFRLQADEWAETTDALCRILTNEAEAPLLRLRHLVHAFIRSECEEAAMRIALNDAAPLYRDAPEAAAARARADATFAAFFARLLPALPAQQRAIVTQLIGTTLSGAGKEFSEQPRTAEDIAYYAEAVADMFAAYLTALGAEQDRACPAADAQTFPKSV